MKTRDENVRLGRRLARFYGGMVDWATNARPTKINPAAFAESAASCSRRQLSNHYKADIRRMVRSFEDFANPGPRRRVEAKLAIEALERALLRAAALREPVVMRIKENAAKTYRGDAETRGVD